MVLLLLLLAVLAPAHSAPERAAVDAATARLREAIVPLCVPTA